MIKSTLTILLTLVCWISTVSLPQDKTSAQEPPLLTFIDLQRNDSVEGPFRIVGYVIDIYKCPPCPAGAMCKPCIPDNIVVTDNIEEKDFSKIKRLRISTEKPEQFVLKKKYSFTVKVKGKIPSGRAISDVELISFEPVKNSSSRGRYFGIFPVFNIEDGQSLSTTHSSHSGRRALQTRRP